MHVSGKNSSSIFHRLLRISTDGLQFGGDSHICIGRHLAVYEMNKVLPQIFRRYDTRLFSPNKLPHVTGFFYIQTGLNV